ncbi:MAG TPA: DinB family protein [Candidatus Limnocylindria bacterium]|jgi:uncharacterized damage-inducible protein DinB
MDDRSTIAPLYRGWEIANERLIERLRGLTPEQLGLPIAMTTWPVWASVSHLAGTRVYWLCHVFGEPGMETTPFTDPEKGWEDDLTHPRDAGELVHALESTWRIVARTLGTWTIGSLSQEARRVRADGEVQMHTRQSVLYRMVTHDAYHIGEISLTLGSKGIGEVDIWRGLARVAT